MIVHVTSIVGRIAALFVVAVVITLLALLLALYLFVDDTVTALQQDALTEQAADIARQLRFVDNHWILALRPDIKEAFAPSYGRYFYVVIDADDHVLFASSNDRKVLSAAPHADVPYHFHRYDKNLAGVSLPVVLAGQKLWIQTAENLLHRDVLLDDVITAFFPRVGWIVGPILAILLVVGIYIVRSSLNPLVDASKQAAAIEPTRLDIRLPEAGIPREILPLVHAVNLALDRLARGYRLQREFTADVAHELRTPLAILRSSIDLLASETAKNLRQDIDMMSQTVEQLLELAEVDTLTVGNARANLRAICIDVVTLLAPLAVTQGKSVAVCENSMPIVIRGNADFLRRAVLNLVQNAIDHTDEGTTVEVEITAEPAILVRDQGPGVPAAQRDLLFQRFWRGDRQRKTGSGLGLPIVARIAEAHGARVTVDNLVPRGAVFALRFPPSIMASSDHDKSDAPPSTVSPERLLPT